MQAAIPGVINLEDEMAADLSLDADIGLVTFRNAELWIQTPRKAGIEHAKLFDERQIDRERLRKVQVGGDERAALRVTHELAGRRIDERVGVEEKLLRAEREIIDRPQECAIVEDAGAPANHGLARLERIVGECQTRSEVVQVAHDAFV